MNRVVLILAAVVFSGSDEVVRAQDTQRPERDDPAKQSQAESLARARSIRMTTADGGSKIKLVETPILRFGDAARKNDAGTLWVWGKSGRPAAIAEIYHSTSDRDNDVWGHAMCLASTEPVIADTDGGRWAPRTAPFELQAIRDARPPADQAAARLRQMKAASREVSAHEFWDPDNTRYDLRLLVTPVYRYSDPENGLIDGAIFVFAHGTNPEVLMFVEARVEKGDAAKWQRGFAPLGSAELVVEQNTEIVWRQPRAPGIVGRPSDPYWLFIVPASLPPSAAGDETKE